MMSALLPTGTASRTRKRRLIIDSAVHDGAARRLARRATAF